MAAFEREPCPDRILDDVGGAFLMGAVGGSAFHFLRGAYNSPNSYRLLGGATAARMIAPRVGGQFAVWGGLFSAFDCGMVYARQREDPWNSIAAGAAAGGVLALRQGLLATGRSALCGAAILGLIEGAGIMINRVMVLVPSEPLIKAPAGFPGLPPPPPIDVQEVPAPSGSTGWFGGLFRRKQQDKLAGADPKSSELLELDLPSTAVPSSYYK